MQRLFNIYIAGHASGEFKFAAREYTDRTDDANTIARDYAKARNLPEHCVFARMVATAS